MSKNEKQDSEKSNESKEKSAVAVTSDPTDDVSFDDDDDECLSSLHDCLALGEVELGLKSRRTDGTSPHRAEEVHRLPLLLRLLSKGRPLSSIPTFSLPKVDDDDDDEDKQSPQKQKEESDAMIEQAVQRLEDRAAMYSVAEGVEVVSCHLAPFVCRKMSKLPPLQKSPAGAATASSRYDTTNLAITANNPASSRFKRRKLSTDPISDSRGGPTPTGGADDPQVEFFEEEEENDNDDAEAEVPSGLLSRARRATSDRESALIAGAAEDSQEAFVTKTLSELALLVVQSLSLSADSSSSDTSTNAISMEDSILSEARVMSSSMDSAGGVMAVGGGDLGATVASLMNHVPVLRHDHVASALCRAAVPQAADLVAQMGANSPAAIPSLLRGCINTLRLRRCNPSIVAAAKQSIRELANLSNREKYRVQTILGQEKGGMLLDLQLEFALDLDPLGAACFLIRHLSCIPTPSMDAAEDKPSAVAAVAADTGDFVDTTGDGGTNMTMAGGRPKNCRSGDDTFAPLSQILAKEPALLKRTLNTLGKAVIAQVSDNNGSVRLVEPIGRVCILLSAHLWVLSCLPTDPSPFREFVVDESTAETRVPVSEELFSLIKAMIETYSSEEANSATKDRPKVSSLDRMYSLVLCIAFATVALTDHRGDQDDAQLQCLEGLKILLQETPSHNADSIASRIACACKSSNVGALRNIAQEVLLTADDDNGRGPTILSLFHVDSLILKRTCDLIAKQSDLDHVIPRGLEVDSFLLDQSIGMLIIEEVDSVSNLSDTIKELLNKVMEVSESSSRLLASRHISSFIENATMYLLSSVEPEKPKIPMILPMQLENMATAFCNDSGSEEQETYSGEQAAFFLQLLYCLVFRGTEPDSAFAVDPLELPLTQVSLACQTLAPVIMHETIRSRLQFYIDQCSPETRRRAECQMELMTSPQILAVKPTITVKAISKADLMQVLRRSLAELSTDPCGAIAERFFLHASLQLSEKCLLTTAVSALLSVPKSPAVFVSYSTLCRDPLVVMKCPASCWQRKGLRRIVLSILRSLLETNDELIKETMVHDDSCSDFVASRNVLVVRCLVSALADNRIQDSTSYCPATVGTVRRLVVDSPGLCSVLLKQGLSTEALDWLVDFVPEMIQDATGYQNLLSERSTLTANERLLVAEGILRIAIANHGNESQSESLAVAALSQVVTSFFLIVGPVGVSVNSLLGEGDGLDATQVARKTTFRILKSLSRVRGYRTGLRNSCVMILQKLSRLCKGEEVVGNLSVSAPGKHKNILREIQDACSKAASAMGSSL